MRILVDTNIVMDILLKREPRFEASYGAIRYAIEQGCECFISAATVADIFYLIQRELKNVDEARKSIERMLTLFEIADVQDTDIRSAPSSSMHDFEAAVVHAIAVRYRADMILTRNTKDFTETSMPIYTPGEFMERANN